MKFDHSLSPGPVDGPATLSSQGADPPKTAEGPLHNVCHSFENENGLGSSSESSEICLTATSSSALSISALPFLGLDGRDGPAAPEPSLLSAFFLRRGGALGLLSVLSSRAPAVAGTASVLIFGALLRRFLGGTWSSAVFSAPRGSEGGLGGSDSASNVVGGTARSALPAPLMTRFALSARLRLRTTIMGSENKHIGEYNKLDTTMLEHAFY